MWYIQRDFNLYHSHCCLLSSVFLVNQETLNPVHVSCLPTAQLSQPLPTLACLLVFGSPCIFPSPHLFWAIVSSELCCFPAEHKDIPRKFDLPLFLALPCMKSLFRNHLKWLCHRLFSTCSDTCTPSVSPIAADKSLPSPLALQYSLNFLKLGAGGWAMGQVSAPARFPGFSSLPGSPGSCSQTLPWGMFCNVGRESVWEAPPKHRLSRFRGEVCGSYCKKHCLLCWFKL